MEEYKIRYEILDYNKYYSRLQQIVENPNNKFPITVHQPIGQTTCGFNIEHFSIGTGPMHIVYMGCAHGNEIISTDYVTQLMENIATSRGAYESFDPTQFTLDFIPCQNPEGFFTTTYALNSLMGKMSEEEIEKFSKKYWSYYREDDYNVVSVNAIIDFFCDEFAVHEAKDALKTLFWRVNRNKEITPLSLTAFLEKYSSVPTTAISHLVNEIWQSKLKDKQFIPSYKLHHKIFEGISFDCIPEIDEKHRRLKNALKRLYQNNNFPIETLANFFSNSQGVNLNDNNIYYYNELKAKMKESREIYANLRDNNLLKSIPGPIGAPNKSLDDPFEYAPENQALFDFLEKQDKKEENYAFFNIHGTGGLVYLYPIAEDDLSTAHTNGVTRDFTFLINNRLATEYTRETGREYEAQTGTFNPYKTMGYPTKISGVGDLLRKKYTSSFILELSKMGGNPIAPYGDRKGNFNITMTANMRANMKMLKTILAIRHLYEISYTMAYDEKGRVHYGETTRRK